MFETERVRPYRWLCAFALVLAAGAPTRAAAEFPISETVQSHATASGACSDAAGRYVVVWRTQIVGTPQVADVHGRRVTGEGEALGSEFRLPTTAGDHRAPFVACQPDGSFMAIWREETGDGDGPAAIGRFFDSAGAPLGSPFVVNDVTAGTQQPFGLCAIPGGDYLAAWLSEPHGGHQYFVRRWRPTGPVSDEVPVDPTPSASLQNLMLRCGTADAVFAWLGGSHQMGQRLDFTPSVVAVPFVFDTSPDNGVVPVIDNLAMAPSGTMVATWIKANQVFARQYDVSGAPLAPTAVIFAKSSQPGTFISTGDLAPPVFTRDGNLLFVTRKLKQIGATAQRSLHGRAFDAAGDPIDDEFFISTPPDAAGPAATVAGLAGDVLVALLETFITGRIVNATPPECAPAPLAACYRGNQSTLVVNDPSGVERDRLTWNAMHVVGVPKHRQALRGLALCLYDYAAGVPELAAEFSGRVTHMCGNGKKACWQTQPNGGLKYVDTPGTFDGTTLISIDGSKAQYSGKPRTLPGPVTSTRYFDADPQVSVQLVSPTGECWAADYATAVNNAAAIYRAIGE